MISTSNTHQPFKKTIPSAVRPQLAKKPERNSYLDVLRLISAIMVVLIHLSCNWMQQHIPGYEFANIWNTVARFAVPIFIMISGALFLASKSDLSVKAIFKKYVSKLIIIYFLALIAYAILNLIAVQELSKASIISSILGAKNFAYQLWYIPAIVGLYLLTPFLAHLRDKKFTKIIFSFLILTSSLFYLSQILAIVSSLAPSTLFTALQTLTSTISEFLPPISIWIGFYLLGYHLNTYDFSKKIRKKIYIATAILLVWNITFSNLLVPHFELFDLVDTLHSAGNIVSLTLSVSLFLLMKNSRYIKNLKTPKKSLLKNLSALTLGVYIVHVAIINLILEYYTLTPGLASIVVIPLLSLLIFTISAILTFTYQKISSKIQNLINKRP